MERTKLTHTAFLLIIYTIIWGIHHRYSIFTTHFLLEDLLFDETLNIAKK